MGEGVAAMNEFLPNPFADSTVATPPETVAQAGASQPHLQDAPAVSSDEGTGHIPEIFHYARKLMKEPPAFVPDEEALLAEIEELPLFLREDGYLRRRA